MIDIDVEHLVIWAIRDQRADLYIGGVDLFADERRADGGLVMSRSADGCAAVEAIAALGCAIDGGAGAARGLSLDPDAAHVAELIEVLPQPMRGLLLRHGRAGTRPPAETRPEDAPVLDRFAFRPLWSKGRPVVERCEGQGRGSWATYCPLELIDRGPGITLARRAWTEWRHGLVLLDYALRQDTGRLTRHRLLPLTLPAQPWASVDRA